MGTETRFVDITYRGLKVAARAKLVNETANAGFIEVDAPLPVGTRITLVDNGQSIPARVQGVVEQESGAKSPPGMRVAWGEAIERKAALVVPEPEPMPEPVAPPEPVAAAATEPVPDATLEMPAEAIAEIASEATSEVTADADGDAPTNGAGRRRRKTKKTQVGRT